MHADLTKRVLEGGGEGEGGGGGGGGGGIVDGGIDAIIKLCLLYI